MSRPCGIPGITTAVARRFGERQPIAGLVGEGGGEGVDRRLMAGHAARANERQQPALGRGHVAAEIDLDHMRHRRSLGDRLGDLLGDVGFRQRRKRHHHFRAGLAQERGDVVGLQQRIDRADDARRRAGDQNGGGLDGVWKNVGDGVARPDAEQAKQIGEPGDEVERAAPA
jgi:hypothetical protein